MPVRCGGGQPRQQRAGRVPEVERVPVIFLSRPDRCRLRESLVVRGISLQFAAGSPSVVAWFGRRSVDVGRGGTLAFVIVSRCSRSSPADSLFTGCRTKNLISDNLGSLVQVMQECWIPFPSPARRCGGLCASQQSARTCRRRQVPSHSRAGCHLCLVTLGAFGRTARRRGTAFRLATPKFINTNQDFRWELR